MIVEFQATADDFADITRRCQRRANSVPWTRRSLLIGALLGAALLFAITSGSLTVKFEAIGSLALIYLSLYLFLADHGPFYKRTIRQIYSRSLGTSWPVRVRVELGEAGITFTQNGIRSVDDWSAIEEIEETTDAIYFLTKDKSVMAVRKRGFKSDADLADFLGLAHHYVKSQEHRRPHQKRLRQ